MTQSDFPSPRIVAQIMAHDPAERNSPERRVRDCQSEADASCKIRIYS
jgi:hypothetical protein